MDLKRTIGLFTLTMYGVGIILGAGVYALVGKVAGETG
jgi:APA family basic amino acid/polyamine antiporter